jgi:hypothetical protein
MGTKLRDWSPKNPRLAPGQEKALWIDRVRVDQDSWKRYRLAYLEAKRVAPELTWSAFLRMALDEYSSQFLSG